MVQTEPDQISNIGQHCIALVTHQFNFKFYIQFVFFFPWCSPPTQYPQLYNMNRVKANDEVAVMPNNAICVQSPKSHVLLADCFAEA